MVMECGVVWVQVMFWEGLVWGRFGMLRKLSVGCDRKTSQAMHGERRTVAVNSRFAAAAREILIRAQT
jgi:hypothetical protein